jgi:hypothetical protein
MKTKLLRKLRKKAGRIYSLGFAEACGCVVNCREECIYLHCTNFIKNKNSLLCKCCSRSFNNLVKPVCCFVDATYYRRCLIETEVYNSVMRKRHKKENCIIKTHLFKYEV